jgi:hypothetical protein
MTVNLGHLSEAERARCLLEELETWRATSTGISTS